MQIFDYNPWSIEYEQQLLNKATELITHNINSQFIAIELLSHLRNNKIVRPKYTTLQFIVSSAINYEKARIATIVNNNLSSNDKTIIASLLINHGFSLENSTLIFNHVLTINLNNYFHINY